MRTALLLVATMLLAGPARGELKPGRPAIDFDLPTLDGKRLTLGSLRGQVVLLDFWASWCGPCKQELPELEKLHRQYAGKGLVIVTINIDEERGNAAAMAKRLGLTLPVALDTESKVAARYEPPTMPTSFVVDRGGVVRFVHAGYRAGDLAKLTAEIDQLLAAK